MPGTEAGRSFSMAGIFSPTTFMPTPYHETSDIYLAAFLLSQGAKFVRCRRVGLRRNEFTFVADAKLHHLLRRYWLHEPMTLVPAQMFMSLRRLKSLARFRMQPGDPFDDAAEVGTGAGDEAATADSPARPC